LERPPSPFSLFEWLYFAVEDGKMRRLRRSTLCGGGSCDEREKYTLREMKIYLMN